MRRFFGPPLAVALAVACLAYTAFVLTRGPAAPVAYRAPASFTKSLQATPAEPSALFVGDSYTAGVGAASSDQGYACRAARAMGWTCLLDAEGGTGFINNGHLNQKSFTPVPQRLKHDEETYRADVVILDAGRNDGSRPVGTVAAAIKKYLADLHKAYPQAKLVMIAPAYVLSTPTNYPFSLQLADRMRELVKPYHGVVLEPLTEDWNGDHPIASMTYKDGIHPSPLAHRVWAGRLIADLKKAGLDTLEAAGSG